ncbi:MAG: ABC transporter substrate-binding protein [Actinomycetota bacterium]
MRHRRILPALIAFALLAVACGDDGDSSDAAPVTTAPSTSTSAPAAESDGGDAPDAEDAEDPDEPAPPVEPDIPEVPEVVFPLTFTDALGYEHTLDEPAQLGCVSIVCTEIMAGLGVAPRASTYNEEPFFFPVGPPEFVVTNLNDLEAWSGAEIDFAVMGGPENATHDVAREIVTVLFVHTPGRTAPDLTGFEAVIENTRLIGQIVDRAAEAEVLVRNLETAIETARGFSTPELADRSFVNLFNGPSYTMEIGNADEVGSWAFCSVILAAELGYCAEVDITAQEINAEAFLELDPDIVAMQAGSLTVETRDDPVWGRISAVENGLAYDSAETGYRFGGVRSLIWSLQEYVHFTVPDSGIPHPGLLADFVPEDSPLVS